MKKLYSVITVAALAVGIGSAWVYNDINHSSSHSYAVSKTFNSTEEITEDSQVIIKGSIQNEYKEEKIGNLLYYVYEVQVNKVYNNLTDQKIDEGVTISLYRLIGIDTGSDVANIVDDENQEIVKGDYLLFLNGGYVEELNKDILVPNTPNQLFKLNQSNGFSLGKSNSNEFENIFESDALPSISEENLIKAIDKIK